MTTTGHAIGCVGCRVVCVISRCDQITLNFARIFKGGAHSQYLKAKRICAALKPSGLHYRRVVGPAVEAQNVMIEAPEYVVR